MNKEENPLIEERGMYPYDFVMTEEEIKMVVEDSKVRIKFYTDILNKALRMLEKFNT